jgi:transcriptional regulator with XRE-family HTH domain
MVRLRAASGLTQQQLAERAGCSQGFVSQLEGGRRVRGAALARVARALGVPVEAIS